MFDFLIEWSLSSKIDKEVARIFSDKSIDTEIKDICSNEKSRKLALKEIHVQKVHAMWFFCESQYIEYDFFDGNFMVNNISNSIEREMGIEYANEIISNILDLGDIPKESEDRLEKVYGLSANRVINVDKNSKHKELLDFFERKVEIYFKEELSIHFS